MIKSNLHTHSYYDDGKDSIDEMVQTAAQKGFSVLGFSGHAYNPIDDGSMTPEKTAAYRQDVLRCQKNPPAGMEIFLGIEEDSLSPVNPDDYDYVIGSVHFLVKDGHASPIDYSKERFEQMLAQEWNNDIYAMSETYYQAIKAQAKNDRMQIVGHIDLIAKYNDDEKYFRFDDPKILAMVQDAVKDLVKAGKIFEMNTGAISRGYRSQAYPSDPILNLIYQNDGKLLINTDCHNREDLDLGMSECIERARHAGFTDLYTLTKDGFVPISIDEFRG